MTIGEWLGTGNTAKVYQWGRNEVIKLFYDRDSAQLEARNAEIIADLPVRSPRYGGLAEVEGQWGVIYERIHGPTLLRLIEPTRQSLDYHAKLMAELQAEIHGVQTDHMPNLKRELAGKIKAASELSGTDKETVLRLLDALPEGRTLCHYDFHPDNIILSPCGPIIIDWLNGTSGAAEADVARSAMMFRSHAVPPQAPGWLLHRESRLLFHDAYVAEYGRLSGLDGRLAERWTVPTLAARIVEMGGPYRTEIMDQLQGHLEGVKGP